MNKTTDNTISNEKPCLPISVAADTLQVHQRTLRIYDDENLLSPSRSPKNRRLYSFNDIEKGKLIQYLTRDIGVNLAGIKIIFGLLDFSLENFMEFTQKENTTTIEKIKFIAAQLNITPEQQAENRAKLLRKGRKKKEALTV